MLYWCSYCSSGDLNLNLGLGPFQKKKMSFLVKLLRSRPSSVGSYRNGLTIQNRFETTKPEVKETVYITQLTEELDETEDEKEARIEKLRNKSRLAENHRNMVNGRVPYPEAKAFYHDSVQYKRRVWARYGGEQSNVYPGNYLSI